MAGSYRHVTDNKGNFTGMDLIDNLGDAHEALEECCDMILWLAGGDRQKIFEAHKEGHGRKRCPPENMYLFTFEDFWHDDEGDA